MNLKYDGLEGEIKDGESCEFCKWLTEFLCRRRVQLHLLYAFRLLEKQVILPHSSMVCVSKSPEIAHTLKNR